MSSDNAKYDPQMPEIISPQVERNPRDGSLTFHCVAIVNGELRRLKAHLICNETSDEPMPAMSEPRQCYQWKRGDAWRVGVKARDTTGDSITREKGARLDWLMQVSQSGGLEWVRHADLVLYPPNNVPIESP